MEEDRLARPALGRADLAQPAYLLQRRHRRERLDRLTGQQPLRIMMKYPRPGREADGFCGLGQRLASTGAGE